MTQDKITYGILPPDTLFMEQDPKSNFEEILHLVPKDRDQEDPFYIDIDLETRDRFYWTSPMGIQYSVFKEDVKTTAHFGKRA